MKISNNIGIRESGLLTTGKSAGASGGPSFSDLLSQAVGETQDAQAGSSAQSVSSANGATSASLPRPSLLDGTDDLVDALDKYGAALADPSLNLKQLEPLTNGLEQKAEQLADSLGQDGGDPLQGLAWQAVSQARAEVLKFRRGDYV